MENNCSILMLNCFANISFAKISPQWYKFLPIPCWLEATNHINLNYTRAEKHVYELYTDVLKDFNKESPVFRFCLKFYFILGYTAMFFPSLYV